MTGGNDAASVNGGSNSSGPSGAAQAAWLELESDPGLFTLLVEDFGVKGVQVEEIYDLSKPLDNSTFGFIFLFKWIDRRANGGVGALGGAGGRRNKSQSVEAASSYVTDADIVNNMFFAHQIIPNSCATHALLSILLNCQSIDLGSILSRFKRSCTGLTPDSKGLAIGSQPRLALAHNSYARPDPSAPSPLRFYAQNRSSHLLTASNPSLNSTTTTTAANCTTGGSLNPAGTLNTSTTQVPPILIQQSQPDLFHFVCFVPINGRLYELDGLKPYPVDHGPFSGGVSLHSDDLLSSNDMFVNGSGGGISPASNSNSSCSSSSEALVNMISNAIASSVSDSSSSSSSSSSYPANWTAKFKQIILNRLSSFNNGHNNHEIRFNLMAVVPDRMSLLKDQIELIVDNRQRIRKLINDLETVTTASQQSPENNQPENPLNIQDENSNTNSETTTTNSEQRQLRSRRSAANMQQQKQQQQTATKSEKTVDIAFNTSANSLIHGFVKQLTSSESAHRMKIVTRLRAELAKILERLELLDACKLFRVALDASTAAPTTSSGTTFDEVLTIRRTSTLNELRAVEARLKLEVEADEARLNEEVEKRKKYRIDALRRKHIYDEFIVTYLKILAESGKLEEIIRNSVLPNAATNNYNLTASSLFLQPPVIKKQRKK